MMRVRIGCVDGVEYNSDELTDEALQVFLDENGGEIGTDQKGKKIFAQTPAEAFKALETLFVGFIRDSGDSMINLMIGGRQRHFPGRHIVWMEFVRE